MGKDNGEEKEFHPLGRQDTNKNSSSGGDFYVFSDVLWMPALQIALIEITPL